MKIRTLVAVPFCALAIACGGGSTPEAETPAGEAAEMSEEPAAGGEEGMAEEPMAEEPAEEAAEEGAAEEGAAEEGAAEEGGEEEAAE